jgi:GntR family transcriptional regulator, transcriptional repressor for pyruvate dehydrogenase complex
VINNMKSGDLVTQHILDLMFRGTVKPGDKLPSAESISKQIGVSIISAREALKNLEAIGLVTIEHGKGIHVTEGGPILEEMLQARKMLECHNVEMAAVQIDEDGLRKLMDMARDMEKAAASGNTKLFSEIDHDFHMTIAKISGNRFLFKVFENTKNILFYQQTMVNKYPGNPEVSITQHRNILNSLAKKDGAAARKFMAQHLDEALRVLKRSIEALMVVPDTEMEANTATKHVRK